MGSMKYAKTTFPSGWYHFRCTQVDQNEKTLTPEGRSGDTTLTLTFTCDVGDRAYQHIICTFNISTQSQQIQKMTDRAGFFVTGEPSDPFYVIQFLGLRCEAKVDCIVKQIENTNFITNVIVDWKPPIVDPDWNVMKPKTDDNFFKTKNKKKLPI